MSCEARLIRTTALPSFPAICSAELCGSSTERSAHTAFGWLEILARPS